MKHPDKPRRPDPARLRELLNYEPATGKLTWRQFRPGVRPGDDAGTLTAKGYIVLTIDGSKIAASQAVWAMTNGTYPTRRLRFIDGDQQNLSIDNLSDTLDVDAYEKKLVCMGVSGAALDNLVSYRAHRTLSQSLLRAVNAAAMREIENEPHTHREYLAGDRRQKKKILERVRGELRDAYPHLYPTDHILPRGRPAR